MVKQFHAKSIRKVLMILFIIGKDWSGTDGFPQLRKTNSPTETDPSKSIIRSITTNLIMYSKLEHKLTKLEKNRKRIEETLTGV